jgi:hypothetical protein
VTSIDRNDIRTHFYALRSIAPREGELVSPSTNAQCWIPAVSTLCLVSKVRTGPAAHRTFADPSPPLEGSGPA